MSDGPYACVPELLRKLPIGEIEMELTVIADVFSSVGTIPASHSVEVELSSHLKEFNKLDYFSAGEGPWVVGITMTWQLKSILSI